MGNAMNVPKAKLYLMIKKVVNLTNVNLTRGDNMVEFVHQISVNGIKLTLKKAYIKESVKRVQSI